MKIIKIGMINTMTISGIIRKYIIIRDASLIELTVNLSIPVDEETKFDSVVIIPYPKIKNSKPRIISTDVMSIKLVTEKTDKINNAV